MSNKVIISLINEKIEFFRFAFQKTSTGSFYDTSGKLIHPGEFGAYREVICKDFLRNFIPGRLEIGSGFIVSSSGKISTQCDIIIYDDKNTPLIESENRQRFFPVETVCSIGEIKSDLDKAGFKDAINKLAGNKSLRDEMEDPDILFSSIERSDKYNPQYYPYDSIFSFLICNKLKFDISNLTEEMDSLYEKNVQPWHKHNMILSIEDGLFIYTDDKTRLLFPAMKGKSHTHIFQNTSPNNIHFYVACSQFFNCISSISIYHPEMIHYLSDR